MATELADYGVIRAWIDGDFQVQLTSISKRTAAGNIPINLMNEGLGGFTNGSGGVNISLGYVIPKSGPEFDFEQAVEQRGYHDIQIAVSGRQRVIRGKFEDNEISQSTDQATAGTVNFIGEFKGLK